MVIIFPQPFFMTYSDGKLPAMRHLERGGRVGMGVKDFGLYLKL